MATTTDDTIYASFPITKFEETEDGNLVVYGKATDGSVDSDEQIVDPEWSGKALTEWMNSGPNLRVMHNPKLYPAGTGLKVEVDRDGDGAHWVKSLVVEDTAKKLVKNKSLRAYSVGISRPVIARDTTGKARGGVIKGGEIFEVSLVDRPANKSCGITLVKSAGAPSDDWTYGDLEKLLAEAEQSVEPVTKSEGAEAPAEGGEETVAPAEGDGEPVTKSSDPYSQWQAARQGWLAAEPDPASATQGPEYLAKRAEWRKWATDGEDAGLGEDGYPLWLAKRNMDPNTGGGVDRDNIPAEDFAGKNRSFPIVTPKDVADAAKSIGRAGDDNYSAEQLKANIIRIAKRKGKAFVAQLPDAWKAGDATKAETDHEHTTADKGQKDCPKCGAGYDADSKKRRCEQCGKKLPKAGAVAEKAKKPKRMLPADVKPAGEHREPDGSSTVEQLEPQAGMDTDTDPVKDKVPPSVETKSEAPYSLVRMHDALCAAYHQDAVVDAYPALKGVADAVDTDWWQAQVAETAAKGDLDAVGRLVDVARAATALKAEDPVVLADARADLHKGFVDLHGKSMTPGAVSPGQFQRPYISGGHAPLSARPGQTPRVPPGTHTPDPGQFDRDTLTAGHTTPSPADTGDNNPTGSVATGASRRYYTTAAREAARNAMQAMHDHIADTFPDMCPMAASKTVLPPDMGDSSRPRPVKALDVPKAPGEKAAQPKVKKHKKTKTKTSAPALDADLIKSIVTEATAAITANYETQITALKAEIDELGRQPDPTQAPVRGVVRTKAATTAPAPVERRNLAAEAQEKAVKAEQRAYIDYLMKCAASGDPTLREKALAVLDGAGFVPQLPTP